MGAKDLIKPYIAEHGEILFGRLNMKPGKPTTFGRLYDKLVFSLPGNPVSCFVTAQLFITRALKIMSGTQNYEPALVNVDIPKPLRLDSNRPEYHRAILYTEEGKENYQCISTGNQQSSRLLSTVTANGFLILPDAITFGKQLYDKTQAKAVVFGEVNHKRK
jgi:molybdopterin biosynthesis enzyme